MRNGLIVFLIAVSSCLYANEESNATIPPLIEQYDQNKDGMIFYTEAPKELQNDFCQYDVNQDGFLDKKEVMAIK